jgi:hypothetical protein
MPANLHIEAMAYLRYVKQFPLVCTEVGRWNADVLGVSSTQVTEVEVKRSISDLRADFRNKRAKHYTYGLLPGEVLTREVNGDPRAKGHWQRAGVPNYLYYLVPEVLKDKALAVLEDWPKYGLLVVPTFSFGKETVSTGYSTGKNVVLVRRAARLHADPPSNDLVWNAIKRLSSELVGAYQAHEDLEAKLTKTLEEVLSSVRASAAVMAAFTPEAPDAIFTDEPRQGE